MSFLYRLGAYLLLKRPVRQQSFAEIVERCRTGGETLTTHLAAAPDSAPNQQKLNHIIGIERWGQSRLQVALGGELSRDEYEKYRPDQDSSFAELRDLFPSVRATTLALAEQIEKNNAASYKVPHNQFGDLDCKSWLYYLTYHADQEARSIK